MQDYDPDQTPDPAQWHALSEGSRMLLVKLYHDGARIRLPKPNLHYAVHVVVENQVAEGMPAVLRAMERLQGEGLSRHDALHAIASVAARRVAELLQSGDPQQAQAFEARYAEELDKLTAQEWRKLADAS
jgi:hypothetical protein